MKISDILTKDNIIAELDATEKREVLETMSALLSESVGGMDKEELLGVLLEREKLGSTGIGYGVAIPHAKFSSVDSISVAFARSRKGVDFESADDQPVHLFFLIIAPESSTVMHLKVLASISKLLKDADLRSRLINATDADEIYAIISEEEGKLSKSA
ncbi:MAG: PTS sugar transporter subunit IIA [Deltaproteobacteria bacterium]|nr:PTS sugar transporter subunit IIA [Deltaproteobacteria bacterium]